MKNLVKGILTKLNHLKFTHKTPSHTARNSALFVLFFIIISGINFSSVVVMETVLAILVVFVVIGSVYLLKPNFVKEQAAILIDKLKSLRSFANKYITRIKMFAVSWVNKFKTGSNRVRFEMTKVPALIILFIILVYNFGYLFLPPKIITSFPGDKSQETSLDSKIEIIFDRGMNRSLAEKNFAITPSTEGKFSWEGNQKLIFTPSKMLVRGTKYQIVFRGFTLSNFLVPLLGHNSLSFETIGNPQIVLSSPQNEALDDISPVTVIFDRPMIALTTATNSAIKQPAFTIEPKVKGEGRWLGTTAYQFRPSERYKKATTYKVSVPAGLRSEDGGALQEQYAWEFYSERPRVLEESPKNYYQYTSPTASVSANFNQTINLKTVGDKFAVYDKDQNKISGRVISFGKTLAFIPAKPLTREEKYTAVISAGIEGIEGTNGMEQEYSWAFTVVAKPGIDSTSPIDGEKDVSEKYEIKVRFDTPMAEKNIEDYITISPKPESKPNFYLYGESLSINTYLARSTTYKVTIDAATKDQYGVPLGKPYSFSFTTGSYVPSISIYPSGTYFGSFNQDVIPRIVAQVTNANKVDYSLYKLPKESLLELYKRRYSNGCNDSSCSNWQNYDTGRLEVVRTWSETYEAEHNVPTHVATKVTLPSGEKIPPGFYFLDIKIADGSHDNMVMIVSKSTLTVKKSDNQIFVWAVNQSSGEVIPNMKIEVKDLYSTNTTGVTNNDGVFVKDVDFPRNNDTFIFGEKDGDVVVAASAWSQGINRYDFGLPSYYDQNESKLYNASQNYKIFVTLDRPIYRPGQKVYFKGVIKKDSDGAYENLTPGEKVNVSISDSQNKPVFSQDLPITSFGSFFGEFELSKEASLGYYQVAPNFQGNTYSHQFQVEEYRKPELAITVKPSKNNYVQGETAGISINSSYYFGAPVSNAPVSWVQQTQGYSFRYDKDWRFEFGDPDSYWSRPWWSYTDSNYYSGQKVTEGKGTTDAKGDLEISLPLDISKQKTSQKMLVEATVNDINNQSIAATQEFIVHKSGLYVGLRPVSYGNQSGKEANVEAIVVDLNGKEVVGTPVAVEFYKRTWETIREKNPDDGRFYYTSKATDSFITSTTVTTDSFGHAMTSFTPSEGGTYKVIGKVTDKNGNQNITGSFLWVSGYGFSASRENNDRILLVTDKRDYLVGENMSVFVASPFASDSAKTLLTMERGSVLDYKVVDTSETSNNFPFVIPPKYTPNVFIGAVLVRGGNQVKKPAEFKVGYTEIKVTDKKQQIDVKISTDKQKYKPNDSLKATIETKDLLGNPIATELAIGLVDKAVWDISNTPMADIYKTFYQPRNLAVSTSQLLTISIDRINANMNLGAKGGSGGGCFTGDTPILMKNSLYKNIADVKVGDVVMTRESDTSSKLVETKVLQTYKHENIDRYLIINGIIRVTPVHKMYINSKWVIAGEALVGDTMLDKNNQLVKIFSIEQVSGNFTVYNLQTEKYHTYFARDIYVHNDKGGNETTRSNFPDTAYWNPVLKTDKNGKASVSIPLPDSLTTWRLAAIANSQEAAFGSNVSEVVVSRDVLIRPFLPRFLSVGDQAKLGAIIVNTSGEAQDLVVRIETQGVKVNESDSKQLSLADGSQQKLTWATITDSTTSAKIKLIVEGKDKVVKDAMEMTLPVKTYSIPEVVATSGEAKDSSTEKIVLPKELDPTQGGANISFTPSLGGDSINSLSYLFDYRYNCAEQTTSRFLPAIFVNRILRNTKTDHIGQIGDSHLKYVINDGIQRLNNQQQTDGGWGWWTMSSSNPYLTAYAYSALSEAKVDKFAVADKTLQKAQAYLEYQLSSGNRNISLDTQAYILYVLRGKNISLSSYAANLYDRRFQLSLEGRAYLTLAMKEMPSMTSRTKRIYGEILSLAKQTSTTTHWEENTRSSYMGSNTTTTAMILETISTFDNKSPLIPQVVRYLMSIRKDGYWGTTRNTSAAIKAISLQLLNKGEEKISEDFRFEMNGKIIQEGKFTKDELLSLKRYAISISDLNIGGESALKITKSGKGSLYYNINLKYYLPFSEIKPLEQGMVIIRDFVDSKGRVLPSGTIKENTEVWVRLIVVAPEERHYVIIEDTLPAGLESVNESLKNVSTLNKEKPKSTLEDNQLYYFDHKEYRDDKTTLFASYLPAGVYELSYRVRATTPGKYHYPPAETYQMYTPDVFGHSAGGWLEVK